MAVAASPDGRLLATSCKATTHEHAVIRVYDTTTWKQVGKPLPGHSLTIARIRFSNNGQYVLSTSRDRTWRLFKRTEGTDGKTKLA
jgi:elongator complex protein 2